MCERIVNNELIHAIKRAMYETHFTFHFIIFKRFASFETNILLKMIEFMQSSEQRMKHSFCISRAFDFVCYRHIANNDLIRANEKIAYETFILHECTFEFDTAESVEIQNRFETVNVNLKA